MGDIFYGSEGVVNSLVVIRQIGLQTKVWDFLDMPNKLKRREQQLSLIWIVNLN